MTNARKPTCPKVLQGHSLPEKVREDLDVDEFILLGDYDNWDVNYFLDSYFLLSEVFEATGHTLYSKIIDALMILKEYEHFNKSLQRFLQKFFLYINTKNIKLLFLQRYREFERAKRETNAEQTMNQEIDITCDELVGNRLAESSRKRMLESSEEDSVKLKTTKKNYTMQSPSTIVTPNTPVIDDSNMALILQKADLCFSSNKGFASEETLNEYNIINIAHDNNQSLKYVSGAFEFFNKILQLDKAEFPDNIAALPYEQNLFNRFIKFACMDYAINCERITPTPLNDERTIFFENVAPLFKYFGNITKTISFRWGEKKDKDSAIVVFYVSKNKGETKLTDGIGSASFGSNCIIIESSGYNATQDLEHTHEDSIKNLVSATDILLSIMCKYDKASINTMKKINVYSVHIIQKKMSFIRYSLKNRSTWKVIECGSAEIPLFFEDKKKMLKVLDLFAFVYHDIESQEKYFDDLEDEHLGFTEVLQEEMLGPLSNFNELINK